MTNACALTCRFLCRSPPHFPFSLIFLRNPPHHPLNPTSNPSPRDTNGNCHPFTKTTPGKHCPLSEEPFKKGGFQKGGFGGCSPGTRTGTRVIRGYVRMCRRNENRNEGTFTKTTLLRNRPFFSSTPRCGCGPKCRLEAPPSTPLRPRTPPPH